MYYTIVCCIKTSILFTYLRFALTRTFRVLCWGTIILDTVFFLICFVVTITQCRPLHKMWDLTGTEPGSCINTTAFFYSTSAFNIITDIFILLLPIPTLRSINRPKREKIALFLIFGAGTFAAISSIIRLHTIYRYTYATDKFHESILVNLWSMIEVCIAVCCASVPALKPVFSRSQRMRSRRAAATNSEQTPRDSETVGSRPRSRLMCGFGSRRWHARVGSKEANVSNGSGSGADLEKVETGEVQRTLDGQMGTGAGMPVPTMTVTAPEPAVVKGAEGMGRPGPKPVPWTPRQGSWLRGVDSDETGESSMLAFTALSPRPMGEGEVARNGQGMSSSESTLILQR